MQLVCGYYKTLLCTDSWQLYFGIPLDFGPGPCLLDSDSDSNFLFAWIEFLIFMDLNVKKTYDLIHVTRVKLKSQIKIKLTAMCTRRFPLCANLISQ